MSTDPRRSDGSTSQRCRRATRQRDRFPWIGTVVLETNWDQCNMWIDDETSLSADQGDIVVVLGDDPIPEFRSSYLVVLWRDRVVTVWNGSIVRIDK